jgi:3-polyprenyl-4-hydroxybenzoate decarboxylase and related decarboxylases
MDLRDYINSINQQDVVRIKREVSPVFEIAAVTARLESKLIIFENVKGSNIKVVTNLCSTRERFAHALSCNTKGYTC